MPNDLRTARIDYGKDACSKSVLGSFPDAGSITDLRWGHFTNEAGSELAIVGNTGYVFVGAGNKLERKVRFAARTFNPVVLLQPKEGEAPVFLGRGGSWLENVRLFDGSGALEWQYSNSWGINGSAAGNLDGDGKLEFAVGLNGGGGLRLLDAKGHELWSKVAANVWHVEIASASEGTQGRIVNSDASGAVTVRDGKGNVISQFRPAKYVSSFELAKWGDDVQPRHLLIPDQGSIVVTDLEGHPAVRLEAPAETLYSLEQVVSVPVSFSPHRRYQATLVNYPDWSRSVLYLNDEAGKAAYREILGHSCGAVGTIPVSAGSGAKLLLLGCDAEVWSYTSRSDLQSRR